MWFFHDCVAQLRQVNTKCELCHVLVIVRGVDFQHLGKIRHNKMQGLREGNAAYDLLKEVEVSGWDAYSVWEFRVQGKLVMSSDITVASGWDPYEVWRTRVRKPAIITEI